MNAHAREERLSSRLDLRAPQKWQRAQVCVHACKTRGHTAAQCSSCGGPHGPCMEITLYSYQLCFHFAAGISYLHCALITWTSHVTIFRICLPPCACMESRGSAPDTGLMALPGSLVDCPCLAACTPLCLSPAVWSQHSQMHGSSHARRDRCLDARCVFASLPVCTAPR